jgi:hypothetical protein
VSDEEFAVEERAALMAESHDNALGDAWAVVAEHPGVLLLCEKFARLGVSIIEVQERRARREAAA